LIIITSRRINLHILRGKLLIGVRKIFIILRHSLASLHHSDVGTNISGGDVIFWVVITLVWWNRVHRQRLTSRISIRHGPLNNNTACINLARGVGGTIRTNRIVIFHLPILIDFRILNIFRIKSAHIKYFKLTRIEHNIFTASLILLLLLCSSVCSAVCSLVMPRLI